MQGELNPERRRRRRRPPEDDPLIYPAVGACGSDRHGHIYLLPTHDRDDLRVYYCYVLLLNKNPLRARRPCVCV